VELPVNPHKYHNSHDLIFHLTINYSTSKFIYGSISFLTEIKMLSFQKTKLRLKQNFHIHINRNIHCICQLLNICYTFVSLHNVHSIRHTTNM